jgi:hypothetical protein
LTTETELQGTAVAEIRSELRGLALDLLSGVKRRLEETGGVATRSTDQTFARGADGLPVHDEDGRLLVISEVVFDPYLQLEIIMSMQAALFAADPAPPSTRADSPSELRGLGLLRTLRELIGQAGGLLTIADYRLFTMDSSGKYTVANEVRDDRAEQIRTLLDVLKGSLEPAAATVLQ